MQRSDGEKLAGVDRRTRPSGTGATSSRSHGRQSLPAPGLQPGHVRQRRGAAATQLARHVVVSCQSGLPAAARLRVPLHHAVLHHRMGRRRSDDSFFKVDNITSKKTRVVSC